MCSVYHGGARENEGNLIDFSQSVNPYYPNFLKKYLKKAEIQRYPYCEEKFERLIGERMGLRRSGVLVGAGVTELLYMSFYSMKSVQKVVMLKHTYSELARLAHLFNKETIFIEKLVPELDDFPIIRNAAYFLVNPDNPTGIYYGYVKELGEELRSVGSNLFLDESFIYFTPHSRSFIESENIVALRSFTKAYGIPGIRIGFAYGPHEILKSMKEFRMPWGIGAYGCAALEGILKEGERFLDRTIPKVMKEKRKLEKRLGLRSDANYFLAGVEDEDRVLALLKSKGILVRGCRSFGLNNMIRFSVRKRHENDVLLKALEGIKLTSPFWRI